MYEITFNVNLNVPSLEFLAKNLFQLLKEIKMDISVLQQEVTDETTVVASAVTLLGQLSQAIKDAGGDPVALKALTDQMDQNKNALAAAISANTPATGGGPVVDPGNLASTGTGTQPNPANPAVPASPFA